MKKVIIILSTLALITSSCGRATKKIETAWEYSGIYKVSGKNNSGGTVYIYPETDSTMLFYLEKNRGAPSYNSGAIEGRITIQDGKAVFRERPYDNATDYFVLHFEFNKNTLTVRQEEGDDYDCGFGGGVYVNDIFKRTSSKIPQYYTNRAEIKIYFSELIEELKKQSNEKDSPRNTGEKFFSDNIQAINETCLIFIAPEAQEFEDENSEEAQIYFNSTDGYVWYSYKAGLRFKKAGINTIHAQKRYLSFALDSGKEHIVDTKERSFSAILYRKGQMPMLSTFADVADIGDDGYNRIASYFQIDKHLLMGEVDEN